MTKKETLRYLNNDDTSTITYKHFAVSPQDTYPTFSFCFCDDGKGSMYRHLSKLFELAIPIPGAETTFVRLLKGQKVFSDQSDKEDFDIRNISEHTIDTFSIKLDRLYYELEFKTKYQNDSLSRNRYKDSNKPFPFYISYLDPGRICYTRNEDQRQSIARIEDSISFFTDEHGMQTLEKDLTKKVFIHHPGQLLRVFDSPVHESMSKDLDYNQPLLAFKINHVSILRKRADANVPCNPDLFDDDLQLRIQVAKDVGCIPVYWKRIMQGALALKTCNTQDEMGKIWNRLQDFNEIHLSYHPPCNQMKMAVTVVGHQIRDDLRVFQLFEYHFKYMEKTYQEIVNERDFGIDSLWSTVGGFVGIFVGTSLSQIPTLIAAACYWIKNLLRNNKKKKNGKIVAPKNRRIVNFE